MLTHWQCDQIKIAKCLKKFPKNGFSRKMIYFDTYTKLTKNGKDWGKLIVARGFKKLPKVQNIAQSGHTAHWRQKQPLYQLRHNPRTYSSKHTFKRWEFVDAKPSLITWSQTASFIIFEKREIVATFRMEKLLVD